MRRCARQEGHGAVYAMIEMRVCVGCLEDGDVRDERPERQGRKLILLIHVAERMVARAACEIHS